MIIREKEIIYDRTDVEDVSRFEDAYDAYQAKAAEIEKTTYSKTSEKLLASCEATADLLRNAFREDLVALYNINTHSLMELTELVIEVTEGILEDNKKDSERLNAIQRKYQNMRS